MVVSTPATKEVERCKVCSNLKFSHVLESRDRVRGAAPYVSELKTGFENGCRFCGYVLRIEHLLGVFVRWNFEGESYSGYCGRPMIETLRLDDSCNKTTRSERIMIRPWQVNHRSLEIYREHSGVSSFVYHEMQRLKID